MFVIFPDTGKVGPIVADEFPRGTLDDLLWAPKMTVEKYDPFN